LVLRPAMKLNDSTEIISVSMIDIDAGVEEELFERSRSRCHFKKPFKFEDYNIQLRLDWSDISDGEPTLDIDIWKEIHGKKKFLKRGKWHHIKKISEKNTGKQMYIFEFKNLKLYLIVKTTAGKNLIARVQVMQNDLKNHLLSSTA